MGILHGCSPLLAVLPGLDPGIHVSGTASAERAKAVDDRDKPARGDRGAAPR